MTRPVARLAWIALTFATLAGCGLFMSPERRIARAEEFIAEGDWGSAAIELRQALEASPDDPRGRLLLARVSFHTGDLRAAEKEVARAVELNAAPADTAPLEAEIKLALGDHAWLAEHMAQPVEGLSDAQRLIYLGYGQLGTDRASEALASFQAALDAKPDADTSMHARLGTAEALAASGQLEAAIAALDQLIESSPEYVRAKLVKATLLVQRGQAAEAEKLLAGMSLADANSSLTSLQRVGGLATLAEAELAQAKLDAADKTLGQLRKAAPNAIIGAYLRARLALARNDPSTAVTEMQRVVQAAPNHAPARFLLAQAYAASGNLAQAETELQAVVQSDPDNVEARKLLADTQIRAGRPAAAIESLFPAVKANTTDPQVYSLYGRAKFEEGDRDTATQFWERSLETAPTDSRLKLNLAASHISAGDSQRALELLATVPDDEGGKQKKQLQLIAMATGKDLGRAKEEIGALVKRNAGDVDLVNLAAAWLISKGEVAQARTYLDGVLREHPDDVQTLLNLSRLQVASKDTAGAEKTLERVLKVKPDSGAALLGLSQLAQARGDEAGAKRWLEEWRKRDPKSAEVRLLLARRALASKDTAAGSQLIDEAVAAAPKQANVANAAGQVLLEAGRYEEALRRFREAIDLSPDSPQLWFNAARAQLALTQRQAARESLGKALSLRPDWLPAAVLMAQIDSREGRTEAALATASKLKRSAEPAVGWMLEGEIRMAMKDYPGAEKAFAESFKLKPSAPGALARYNARRAGKMPQPEQVLVDWLADHPDDARVRFALAEARQAQGDYKAAIREYESMLAKSPNSAIVLNNLAWLYSETGNTRAEDLAARAYKAAPDSWAIADTYGWILVRANKPKEGLAILKQAVEKSNNNAEVLYHLGVAQSKAGETVAAKETLSRAVADARGAPWKAEAEKVLESAK